MKSFRRLLLGAAFMALSVFQSGATEKFSYDLLSAPLEIANTITKVYIVPNSYAWCATDNGLLRIDYYTYTKYSTESTGGALPSNEIIDIREDNKGNLWISTLKGLCRYDYKNDTFIPLQIEEEEKLVNLRACGTMDSEQGLLIGGKDAIYLFDYETGIAKKVAELGTDGYYVDTIFEGDYPGQFFLFCNDLGFKVFDLNTGEIKDGDFELKDSYCFHMDPVGRFWRSVYGKGIECYNREGKVLARYTTKNGLSNDVVNCIVSRQGKIWAGTETGGIDIIDPQSGEVTVLSRTLENRAFPANGISSLFVDANGVVWATRTDKGVFTVSESIARSYYVDPFVSNGESLSTPITAAIKDNKKNVIWLGTASGGIRKFNLSSEKVAKVNETGCSYIESMTYYDKTRLLVRVKTSGLYLFNTETKAMTPFKCNNESLSNYMLNTSKPVSIISDCTGNVIITTLDGSYWVDRAHNSVISVPEEKCPGTILREVTGSASHDFFSSNAIYRHNDQSKSLEIVNLYDDFIVNYAAVMQDGTYWLATSTGLWHQTNDGNLHKIETDFFKSVDVVVPDSLGRLWLGAGMNMYVYLPDNGSFVLVDSTDGVKSTDYSFAATFSGDHIIMGGTICFSYIDASQPFFSTGNPEISVLTAVIGDRKVDPKVRTSVSSKHSDVKIRVLASECNMLRKKMFRFTVKGSHGFVDDIISDSPEMSSTYNDAGRYVIYASCTNRAGDWTEPVQVLRFRIRNVWYASIWFYLFACIFIIAFGSLVARNILKAQFMNKRHESDQERLKFLLNVSHELKTPLTLIIGPLERIIKSQPDGSQDRERLLGIRRQAIRMKTLILTVLDSYKIEEGATSLYAQPVDINNWVGNIAEDFRDEMSGHKIELLYNFDANLSSADIDSEKLINVVTNMLINALKHSSSGKSITVGTSAREGGMLRVFVSDQGPGLGGVDMTKLFRRYYQGMTEKTGTGMGLAYADTIVRLHGGEMGAYENHDVGATFYFDIPVKQPSRK